MKVKRLFTVILAIAGTVLAWLPLLAPVILGVASFATERLFRFDYLMPAELFPVALAGAAMLLAAALLARSRRAIIGAGAGAALGLLVGGQAVAMATGLADGRIVPSGWQWTAVAASLAGYCLALAAVGVGGVLLLRDLFGGRVSRG